MTLSPHFTLEEMIFSQTAARKGIDNTPSPAIIENLKRLAVTLEQIRVVLDEPIIISSGYRCPKLNQAIGGSKNSAHMLGLAADFTAPDYGSVVAVAHAIAASDIAYDQLIYEYGTWVHVGLSDGPPRRQNLSIFKGTSYLPGILNKP